MALPLSPTEDKQVLNDLFETFPDLQNAKIAVLTHSFDSVALDVEDAFIFKFPRNASAEKALRKEALFLAEIRPRVAMRLPDLQLFENKSLFSRHRKIPGEHLNTPQYLNFDDRSRQQLAEMLAQFYAALHALGTDRMVKLGASPIGTWLPPDIILEKIHPLLPSDHMDIATRVIHRFVDLPHDPLGKVFGHFDGHGWNMAFDHAQQQLNGLYDFSDSGIGPLHQEFIYSSFISADLTFRMAACYEKVTGLAIDRERIWLLTAMLRLSELASDGHDPLVLPQRLRAVSDWLEHDGMPPSSAQSRP